jgi:hypothetical protein
VSTPVVAVSAPSGRRAYASFATMRQMSSRRASSGISPISRPPRIASAALVRPRRRRASLSRRDASATLFATPAFGARALRSGGRPRRARGRARPLDVPPPRSRRVEQRDRSSASSAGPRRHGAVHRSLVTSRRLRRRARAARLLWQPRPRRPGAGERRVRDRASGASGSRPVSVPDLAAQRHPRVEDTGVREHRSNVLHVLGLLVVGGSDDDGLPTGAEPFRPKQKDAVPIPGVD